MADEKIKITLSSNAEMSGWDATQKAANDFQRKNKDLIAQGVRGVQTLTTAFGDSGLAGTINKTAGVLAGLATGGVFGMIGAAANSALTAVIGYFKEMHERAKAFKDYLQKEFVEGLSGAGEQATALGKQIQEANKEVDDLIKTSNGKISGEAKNAVAKLHVETLQALTESMSEAAQKVVLADEALAAAKITHAANVKAAAEAQTALEGRLYAIGEEEAQASALVAQAKNAVAEFENRYGATLTEVNVAQIRARQTVEEMVEGGMNYNAAIKAKQLAVETAKRLEEENAEVLKQHKELLGEVATAEAGLADAAKNRAAMEERVAAATLATDTARAEETAATMRLTAAKEEAVNAAHLASMAEAEKASADEKASIIQIESSRIEKVCNANKVKYAEYLALFTQLIEEGKDTTTAYNELQKKLNGELEKRAAAEAEASALTEADTADRKSGKKDKAENAGASSSVSVSIGNPDDIADKGWNWRQEEHDRRDAQRAARDLWTDLKGNQPNFVKLLKGEMPRKQADAFVADMIKKCTPDQIEKLAKLSFNSQMLSKKEQQDQIKTIEKILKAANDALAVK